MAGVLADMREGRGDMLYVSLGIPGSASTWIFNVIKSILKKRGVAYQAYSCETIGSVNKNLRQTAAAHVWKSHNMEPALLHLMSLGEIPLIVSVRDPRDAVASLAERFGANPTACVQQVVRSIASVFSAVAASPRALVFEYELGFPERVETVQAIADRMGLPLSTADLDDILAEFHIERVREFTRALEALPAERLVRNGTDTMDTETQFHRAHVSDAAIGKWRDKLPGDMIAEVDALFAPVAGMAFYEPGMKMIFRPHLFRGGAYPAAQRRPRFRNGGFCLLESVHLGQGRWTVELTVDGRGAMRAASAVRMVQGPETHLHEMLKPMADNTKLRFDLPCTQHDTPLEVFLMYNAEPEFSQGVVPRASLSATYLGRL